MIEFFNQYPWLWFCSGFICFIILFAHEELFDLLDDQSFGFEEFLKLILLGPLGISVIIIVLGCDIYRLIKYIRTRHHRN